MANFFLKLTYIEKKCLLASYKKIEEEKINGVESNKCKEIYYFFLKLAYIEREYAYWYGSTVHKVHMNWDVALHTIFLSSSLILSCMVTGCD